MDLTRVSAAAVVVLFTFASSGAAQSITVPSVAPTPADDSLYRLAVDPAKYEGEATHGLEDVATIKVEDDGHVLKTFRRVVQVMTEAGASRLREQQFGYVPGHQAFAVHWLASSCRRPDPTSPMGSTAGPW